MGHCFSRWLAVAGPTRRSLDRFRLRGLNPASASEQRVEPPAGIVGERLGGSLLVLAQRRVAGCLGLLQHRDLLLPAVGQQGVHPLRSEEHTSELQSLMRISYAVFCLE